MCFWAPIIAAHVVHLSMGCRALQQCPCVHPVPTLAAAAAGRDVPPWAATALTAAPTHPLLSLASPALQYEISMDAYERLSNTTGAWQLDEENVATSCGGLRLPYPATCASSLRHAAGVGCATSITSARLPSRSPELACHLGTPQLACDPFTSARLLLCTRTAADAKGRKLKIVKVPCPPAIFRTYKEAGGLLVSLTLAQAFVLLR